MRYLQKSCKGKLKFTDDSKVDVTHKNIILKNLANKIASTESLDYESDQSNESTLSEGALNQSKKLSPKFVSEPNLSIIDQNDTPKNTKKRGTRLFRSKVISGSQNLNKKYQKRGTIRGTPTCVSCLDTSENESIENDIDVTPKKSKLSDEEIEFKMHYLTSTPGLNEEVLEECSTPYVNFRRASMSPITKSTQKLSKAMQVCLLHVWILLDFNIFFKY